MRGGIVALMMAAVTLSPGGPARADGGDIVGGVIGGIIAGGIMSQTQKPRVQTRTVYKTAPAPRAIGDAHAECAGPGGAELFRLPGRTPDWRAGSRRGRLSPAIRAISCIRRRDN